jgi:hypothetical protein
MWMGKPPPSPLLLPSSPPLRASQQEGKICADNLAQVGVPAESFKGDVAGTGGNI